MCASRSFSSALCLSTSHVVAARMAIKILAMSALPVTILLNSPPSLLRASSVFSAPIRSLLRASFAVCSFWIDSGFHDADSASSASLMRDSIC